MLSNCIETILQCYQSTLFVFSLKMNVLLMLVEWPGTMISGFWCAAAMQILDGGSLLIPAVHPHVDKHVTTTFVLRMHSSCLSSRFC